MRALLRFSLLCLFTFSLTANSATLSDAFAQYRDGEFVDAYQQFDDLLPLANSTAALQMSLMTLDEEGTEYDPAMAFALAQLATAWEHPDGQALHDHIEPHLTDAQHEQADSYRDGILARQQVHQFDTQNVELTPLRETNAKVLEYAHADYPDDAEANGRIGWLRAIVLVTTEGEVAVVDKAGSSITPEFEEPSYEALERWRYEPLAEPEPRLVQFDYTLARSNQSERGRQKHVLDVYAQHIDRLWAAAQKGDPGYQYILGQVLTQAVRLAQADSINFDNALPASTAPSERNLSISGGTVTWPQSWSGSYWLNKAARNGYYEAQWALAVNHEEWMRYLIGQGDVQAKTWHGAMLASRAINEDDRDYGLQLLREARDSGDETAVTVAAHYLRDNE